MVFHFNQPTCQHYWDIEPANGPTSKGICRYCGEQREFRNSVDDYALAARAHTAACSSLERRILAEATTHD